MTKNYHVGVADISFYLTDEDGNIKEDKNGNEKILSYHWYFPEINNQETLFSFFLIISGTLIVYLLDRVSKRR